MLGVLVALLIGKPIGIFLGSWIAVRAGWCRLPSGLSWRGVLLMLVKLLQKEARTGGLPDTGFG